MKYPVSDNFIINEETLPVISHLAESIPGGFFIYHADGDQELIYFNSHLPAIFGCDSEEEFRTLVGNSFRGIVHPDDYAENESDILSQVQENEKNNDHVRYRFIRKDGSVGMMDDYGHFSHSDSFGDIYYVFVQDITEQYREEQEHKENIKRIMALEDTFGCLYDVDLETGSYVYYVNNHLLTEDDARLMEYKEDFFADTVRNAELVICPEDREDLVRVLNRDFVIRTLETENFFDWNYRLLTGNGTRWARLRFVYKDKEKKHVIVGAFNAEAEMAAKERDEKMRKELILGISGSESTYIVRPGDDRFTVLAQNQHLEKGYPENETYTQSITRYIETDVLPSDRKEAMEVLNLENLAKHLESGNELLFRFRDISSGYPCWYEARAVKLSGEEILLAFSNMNAEVINGMVSGKLKENFFSFYYIDLDSGLTQIIQTAHPGISGEAGSFTDYTALMKRIAAASKDETAEFYNRISSIDYTRNFFKTEESSYYIYKSYIFEGNKWVNATGLVLARHEDGTPSALGMGFSLLDEEACEKEEARIDLQKTKAKLDKEKRRNDVLHDIINSGKWSFFVNEDDEITSGNVSDEANSIIRNDVPADGHSWLDIVHPDDRKYAEEAFSAAIRDHSCNTPYDVNYRMADRNGNYRWFHSAGRMIRNEDGSGEFFGIHVDITEQTEEQQKRLLGAMPLSNDVLAKANIGMWAFELDEGQPPRMYDDETMLRLVGLDHQVPPEEAYHAWYDHIDEGSYELVADAVSKMASGEHAEVQYPWHHPDGRVMIVRCGGVRNPEYTKGIRIEGTHQDVTQTLHYDEKAARHQQLELEAAEVRAEMLAFISDNEPDVDRFMEFFGRRVLEVTGCDQVIFRNMEGHRTVVNAEGIEDIPQNVCSRCLFSQFQGENYGENGVVQMDNCADGCCGMRVHPACPAKSSYMEKVYSEDKLVGLLSVHYLRDYHKFSENDIDILTTVKTHLGLLLMRIEAKRAEMEKLKAESANAAKTDFLFNMSHDIRTPMNAIIGFTSIAKKEIDNREKALDSLEKVQTSSDILLNLINDVLDMSRIESGKVELHEEKYELIKAFDSFEPAMANLAASKDIDLQFRIGPVRDRYVYVDGPRFDRVLINIISNAVKYTPAEGSVRVSAEQIEDTVPGSGNYRFTVSDTGIGMSEEFQKHMYESFSREYNAITRDVQGTGLGLSLAKRLVDLMGGTISCVSAPGAGTTFTIIFPFRLQTEDDMAEKEVEVQELKEINLTGKRALLVEDNELNREIAEEILSDEGIIVETAADGRKAVDKVSERGADYYDFILMDIQMPVMNGYEATRAIHALMPDIKAPVIALSANAFAEDRRKSLEAGMDAHVAKPINITELLGVLAKYL